MGHGKTKFKACSRRQLYSQAISLPAIHTCEDRELQLPPFLFITQRTSALYFSPIVLHAVFFLNGIMNVSPTHSLTNALPSQLVYDNIYTVKVLIQSSNPLHIMYYKFYESRYIGCGKYSWHVYILAKISQSIVPH